MTAVALAAAVDVTVSEKDKLAMLNQKYLASEFYKQYLRERSIHNGEAPARGSVRSESFSVLPPPAQTASMPSFGSVNQFPPSTAVAAMPVSAVSKGYQPVPREDR